MLERAHLWIKLEPNLYAGDERSGCGSFTAAAVDCWVYLSSADNITLKTASTDLIHQCCIGVLSDQRLPSTIAQ